jgi:pullulanase/glycogen debranching enzyme
MATNMSPDALAALYQEADRVPLAVDWPLAQRAPLAFACRVIQACRLHPGFRRRGWKPQRTRVTWLRPDAAEMRETDWQRTQTLIALLDDDCYLAINAGPTPVEVLLPAAAFGRSWRCICTSGNGFLDGAPPRAALAPLALPPRSIAAFVREDGTHIARTS